MRTPIPTEEILQELQNDRTLSFRDKGDFLREGRCPDCGHKTLWIGKGQPWMLRCDREGKCGYQQTVKDRYPHLFENWAKRFPATEADPKATARAYMINQRALEGPYVHSWYAQGVHKLKSGKATETVRFDIAPGMTWERLIENRDIAEDGSGKTRIKKQDRSATYKGCGWMPPTQKLEKGDKVYIVEGIFCCISLALTNRKSIAAISASNFPYEVLGKYLNKDITWVVSYDNDRAGEKYIPRYVDWLKENNQKFEVSICPKGVDYNDALIQGKLNDKFLEQCNWAGRIFIAPTPKKRAYAMFGQKRFLKVVFPFREQLFAATFSEKEFSDANEHNDFEYGEKSCWDAFNRACNTYSISNCVPTFLYANKDIFSGELRYEFEVKKAGAKMTGIASMSAGALQDARLFSKELLSTIPGACFDGSPSELSLYLSPQIYGELPQVRTIPYVGYEKTLNAYVFPEFGFKNGKYVKVNEHGFLDFDGLGIKTNLEGSDSVFKLSLDYDPSWIMSFMKVFHLNGVAALGYFTASLFTRQIKEKHKAFAFLEITGEKDAGKTTLIQFLWCLLGRENFEGADLLSLTEKARGRHLGKVSNLPFVAIESDRESTGNGRARNGFNWDVFKKVYGLDGIIDGGATKDHTNKTNDRIFQGSLVFSQNETVDASPAMLSRIVHLHCTTAHKKVENRPLADALKTMDVMELSGYLYNALTNEEKYLNHFFTAFDAHRAYLTEKTDLSEGRVIDCHAQVMAAVDALQCLVPQLNERFVQPVLNHLVERAKARQARLGADHPLVELFFETFNYLNTAKAPLNHSLDPALLAINLNEYREACRDKGQELPPLEELKTLLKSSTKYPYVGYKHVRSVILDRSLRCWVFKNPSGD